jgi:tRNA(Ile)-lysidine synthase TilS/MesJ
MNMVHGGRLSVFKPKMYLDRSDIWFIRPLALSRELTIMSSVKQAKIPVVPCSCPLEGTTERDIFRVFLKETFYTNPKWKASYENFSVMLMNEDASSLWFPSQIEKDEKK